MEHPPRNADTKVASTVQALLAESNQTKEWLVTTTGISRSNLYRRLNGSTSFTIDELSQISRALNVPLSRFVLELSAA